MNKLNEKNAKEIIKTISILGYIQAAGFALLFVLIVSFISNLIIKENFLIEIITNLSLWLSIGIIVCVVIVFYNLNKLKCWARIWTIILEVIAIIFLMGIYVSIGVEQGLLTETWGVVIGVIFLGLLVLIIPISITFILLFNKNIKKLFKKRRK